MTDDRLNLSHSAARWQILLCPVAVWKKTTCTSQNKIAILTVIDLFIKTMWICLH